MNVNYALRVAVAIAVLGLWASTGVAKSLDDFPLPDRSESWWVTKGSNHNGHQIQIMRFKSRLTPSEVLQFYKSLWQSDSEVPGFMQSSANGWQLISRLTEHYQWVVQVKVASGRTASVGLISQLALKNTVANGIANIKFMPDMHGGTLVSSTHSEEPALARTQTVLFSGRPGRVADTVKRHAQDHGWDLQDEYVHKQAVTLRFQRAGRQLDVALASSQHGRTLIFLNEVIHGPQ